MQTMLDPKRRSSYSDLSDSTELIRSAWGRLKNIFVSDKGVPKTSEISVISGNIFKDESLSYYYSDILKIANSCPDEISYTYLDCLEQFVSAQGWSTVSESKATTYEAILKRGMERSKEISILGWLSLPSIFGTLVSLLGKALKKANICSEFAENSSDLGDIVAEEFGPLTYAQTIVLSMNWAYLIMEIYSHATQSEPSILEKNKISKVCIGLLGFFTQIMHRTTPGLKHIRMIYSSIGWIGDYVAESPRVARGLNKCFETLFPDKSMITRFPKWHKKLEQQIGTTDKLTMGKAINISYTFRVGDIFITSIRGKHAFSDEVMERFVSSLSPAPLEEDIKRMIELYTKDKIYV